MSQNAADPAPADNRDRAASITRNHQTNDEKRSHSNLSIPRFDEDADVLTAALAYAEAGWYVGPVKAGSKHPGNVLGDRWHTKTSRDPQVIAAWFAGADHGVFLHVGRSGAIVFDVDHPDKMPATLRKAIAQAAPPFQSTRTDEPARGHYVFATPPGRTFGNGTGRLGGAWGEVRGQNGVIVVEPSTHAAAGGRYLWTRSGNAPVLPRELAEALPRHLEANDAATDRVVDEFLARDYSSPARPDLAEVHVRSLTKKIEAGESRHESTVGAVVGACKDAAAGLVDPGPILDTLEGIFLAAVTRDGAGAKQGPARTLAQARSEWRGIRAWAVAQALACDVEAHRTRVAEMLPPEVDEDAEAAFWASSPELATIFDFALARLVSPWAVLGVVLVRVAHTVPPEVVLPAIVGGTASLNSFVALVGPSGGGKGAATAVATQVLPLEMTVDVVEPASGEGIIAAYVRHRKIKGQDPVPEMYRHRVVLSVPEVDTLTALGARSGSTIDAHLRSLWSGELVGSNTSDPSRRRQLEAGTYRAGLILGVQPERSEALFDAASGGTPQRFLWMPATDPRISADRPVEPEPIALVDQRWDRTKIVDTADRFVDIVLTVPPEAEAEIVTAAVARARGEVDALDGHSLLARLKAAQLLAFLEGRRVMTPYDWQRSAVLMAVSDRTRKAAQQAVTLQRDGRAQAAGRYDAIHSESAAEVTQDAATKRVAKVIRRHAAAAGSEGIAKGALRKKVTSRDREHFDEALDRAVEVGDVEIAETWHGERVLFVGDPS